MIAGSRGSTCLSKSEREGHVDKKIDFKGKSREDISRARGNHPGKTSMNVTERIEVEVEAPWRPEDITKAQEEDA